MKEASPISPPVRLWTSLGRIGMTRPMPRTSMKRVIRTKITLALRVRIQQLRGTFRPRVAERGAHQRQARQLHGCEVDLGAVEAVVGVVAGEGADAPRFAAAAGLGHGSVGLRGWGVDSWIEGVVGGVHAWASLLPRRMKKP